jgi:hypothetical protein
MKTKIAQLVCYVNQIDRRSIQFAYFAFTVIAIVIMKKPYDGGTDPI